MNDDNFYKEGYDDWSKDGKDKKIWWTGPIDSVGGVIFSFDKKTVFDLYRDYPEKLTPEQVEIFKRERPELARFRTPR